MAGRPGGRGWGAVLGLALAVASLASVVHPALLIFVPLSLLLIALPPRRPAIVAFGVALAVIAFRGAGGDDYWFTERGWALLVGGWYVAFTVVRPSVAFVSRALAAVGAAIGSAAVFFVADREAWARFDWEVSGRLHADAQQVAGIWGRLAGDGWNPELTRTVYRIADIQAALYPALLALGTVAALAVAWWAYRRFALGEARPLSPLREFRFRDELVWLLIGAVLLVMLPLGEAAIRAGSNLLVFMGALYALRGAAVILAVAGSPGILGGLFAALAVVLLYPLVMAATLLVGLSDTWLDLRARRRTATRPGP